MSRRLRPWVAVGLLVLAGVLVLVAVSLPYLPLLHGTTAQEVERLAAWLEVQPGMRVADVGAGDGTFALALARRLGPSGQMYATELDVVRGPDGHGTPGFPCSSCHGEANLPTSYGPHAPPGAPYWGLPPPNQKMAWMGLSAKELCEVIQNRNANGDRDFAALIKHISEDPLVLWGWNPGGERTPVPVPHDEFVAQFKLWADAGGP
jgi:hypothetical protein